MTATEREIAAYWLGFGAALRGAFGPLILDAVAVVLAPRMFPGSREESSLAALNALIADMPAEADEQIRQLLRYARKVSR